MSCPFHADCEYCATTKSGHDLMVKRNAELRARIAKLKEESAQRITKLEAKVENQRNELEKKEAQCNKLNKKQTTDDLCLIIEAQASEIRSLRGIIIAMEMSKK